MDNVTKQLEKFTGNRIRLARETANLTQAQLATRLGKKQDAISEYEQGRRAVPASLLPDLSRVLGVGITYFFPEENDVFSDFSDEERETLAQLSTLSITARNYIISFIRHSLKRQHKRRFMADNTSNDDETLWEREIVDFERDTMQKIISLQNIAEENRRKLSHELLDPLNAIVGFTSILLDGLGIEKLDERTHGMIQRVSSNGHRLMRIIHELIVQSDCVLHTSGNSVRERSNN